MNEYRKQRKLGFFFFFHCFIYLLSLFFIFIHLHLSDAFIQSDLHCIQVTVLPALAFPGNRTHDLGVASAMLYHLSYRKAYDFCLTIKSQSLNAKC